MDPESIPKYLLDLPIVKYAVQFPDGEIPGQYIYDSKYDLKEFAWQSFPERGIVCWKDAKRIGYRIIKVGIVPIEKAKH